MVQVKLFNQSSSELLERDINEWLGSLAHPDRLYKIISIDYSTPRHGLWTTLITYDVTRKVTRKELKEYTDKLSKHNPLIGSET